MDRNKIVMRSLRFKSYLQFLLATALVLIIGSPLFFHVMLLFYAGDLDEVIQYRATQFKEQQLPILTHIQVEMWNEYNPDLQLLDYNDSVVVNQPMRQTEFNEAKGHLIDYRMIYIPVEIEGKQHLIMSRTPMIDIPDLVKTIIYQIGLIFLFILIAQTLIQRTFVRGLWKPFFNTLKVMNKFDLTRNEVPKFKPTNTTEFKFLNDGLTQLMENSIKSYTQQKHFIENASHELQTPLAIIQSQLDLLVQDPHLTESQNAIIQDLYRVTGQTKRLNKNLLLLAKIENSQFNEIEDVLVNSVISKLVDLFSEIANAEGVSLKWEIESTIAVKGNKSLTEILITNLLSNGLRHNKPEGEMQIRIVESYLIIANSSNEPQLDEEKLFQRFSGKQGEKKGNGLGLAIAQQICKFHKWQLHYLYKDEMHQFIVDFNPVL